MTPYFGKELIIKRQFIFLSRFKTDQVVTTGRVWWKILWTNLKRKALKMQFWFIYVSTQKNEFRLIHEVVLGNVWFVFYVTTLRLWVMNFNAENGTSSFFQCITNYCPLRRPISYITTLLNNSFTWQLAGGHNRWEPMLQQLQLPPPLAPKLLPKRGCQDLRSKTGKLICGICTA